MSGVYKSSYLYTTDKTPFSTCKRTVKGREVHRCKNTGKARRHIRRHRVVMA